MAIVNKKTKKEVDYVCPRFVRYKNGIIKFSVQNSMVPAQVPKEYYKV